MTEFTLAPLPESDIERFVNTMHASFVENKPEAVTLVPKREDLAEGVRDPAATALLVLYKGTPVGGAVLKIDAEAHKGELELFFIERTVVGRGLGTSAWRTIELAYPGVRCWTTFTPYRDERNVHFYVNKLGFAVTAVYSRRNPGALDAECLEADEPFVFLEKHLS